MGPLPWDYNSEEGNKVKSLIHSWELFLLLLSKPESFTYINYAKTWQFILFYLCFPAFCCQTSRGACPATGARYPAARCLLNYLSNRLTPSQHIFPKAKKLAPQKCLSLLSCVFCIPSINSLFLKICKESLWISKKVMESSVFLKLPKCLSICWQVTEVWLLRGLKLIAVDSTLFPNWIKKKKSHFMKAKTVARIKLLTISSNQWLKESKTTIKNKQKHHSSMVLIKVLVFFNIINFMSSKSACFHEELDTYKGRTLTFVYRICFCTNKQTNPLLYIHGTKTVLFQLNPSVYILFSVI